MEIVPRLVVLGFVIIGNPPIVVGLSILRVYLYSFGEISNGLVILAFFHVGSPTIAVGLNIFRIYLSICVLKDISMN